LTDDEFAIEIRGKVGEGGNDVFFGWGKTVNIHTFG
jgi:hypothetical protein